VTFFSLFRREGRREKRRGRPSLRSFSGERREDGKAESAFFELPELIPPPSEDLDMSLGPHYVLLGLTSISVTQVESEFDLSSSSRSRSTQADSFHSFVLFLISVKTAFKKKALKVGLVCISLSRSY